MGHFHNHGYPPTPNSYLCPKCHRSDMHSWRVLGQPCGTCSYLCPDCGGIDCVCETQEGTSKEGAGNGQEDSGLG